MVLRRSRATEWQGQLKGDPRAYWNKFKDKGRKRWYYLYKDTRIVSTEEGNWASKVAMKGTFSAEAQRKEEDKAGLMVLVSNKDMDAEDAYSLHDRRWPIELVFNAYKSALKLNRTREHGDCTFIGSEFIDFLSVVFTYRLLDLFDRSGLLYEMDYDKIMDSLARVKKVRGDEGEWEFATVRPGDWEVMERLGLVPRSEATEGEAGAPEGERQEVHEGRIVKRY